MRLKTHEYVQGDLHKPIKGRSPIKGRACRQLQKQKEKPGEFLIYPLIDLKYTSRKAGLPFTDYRCVPLSCSTCITHAAAHEYIAPLSCVSCERRHILLQATWHLSAKCALHAWACRRLSL